MPTASILVDRITALVRRDTVAMEKIAKVAENTLNPGTYKGGGGGGGGGYVNHKVFLSFFVEDKTSAPDVFRGVRSSHAQILRRV